MRYPGYKSCKLSFKFCLLFFSNFHIFIQKSSSNVAFVVLLIVDLLKWKQATSVFALVSSLDSRVDPPKIKNANITPFAQFQ